MDRVLSVENFGVKIIMLQVVPGYEYDLARFYTAKLKKIKRRFKIFKALGHYDLFIFYESKDFGPDIINFGAFPNILKSNEILCFPWEIRDKDGGVIKEGFNFNKLENRVIGLSFLKINPEVLLKTGAVIEESFVKYCKDKENISILGSFGWNEFVLLVHEEDFNKTYKTLLDISKLQVLYEKDRKAPEIFLLKTVSFLGVNFSLIESLRENPDSLKRRFDYNISSSLFPSLYVTCCSEYMKDILAEGEHYFGPGNVLMGTEDIRFEVRKPKTWGECITEVFFFRLRNMGKIFSTAIQVNKKETPGKSKKPKKISKLERKEHITKFKFKFIKITENEIQKIAEIHGQQLKDSLVSTIYTFNSLIQNRIVRDSFSDMFPFVKQVKSLALDREKGSDEIGNYIDHIVFGTQQRSSSTFSGIDNVENRLSPFKGGIQRTLQAIELLPHSILNDFNIKWSGFVNAGEAPSFKAELLVLNIPIEYLFYPEEWWGLFHEIGHISTLVDKTLFDYDEPEVQDFIHRVIAVPDNTQEYDDLMALIWEVAADIFDYKFGFIQDIETYYKVVWEYLEKYYTFKKLSSKEHLTYFFRSMCIFLYNLIYDSKKLTFEEVNDQVIKETAEKLVDLLKKNLGKNSRFPFEKETLVAEILPTMIRFKDLLRYFSRKYTKFNKLIEEKKSYLSSQEMLLVLDTLKKGQVYWGRIQFPEMLIYKFKKENVRGFRPNTALILTFWHNSVSRFLSHLK